MVRDAALLVLPLAPLCRDDCLGPAPDEFPALVEDAAEVTVYHGEAAPDEDEVDDGDGARDPRWAALDQLKFD
jgi:uncharacterized protein